MPVLGVGGFHLPQPHGGGNTGMGSTGLTHNPGSAWKENTENTWSCWASPARQMGGCRRVLGIFGILGIVGVLGIL